MTALSLCLHPASLTCFIVTVRVTRGLRIGGVEPAALLVHITGEVVTGKPQAGN